MSLLRLHRRDSLVSALPQQRCQASAAPRTRWLRFVNVCCHLFAVCAAADLVCSSTLSDLVFLDEELSINATFISGEEVWSKAA